MTRDFDDPEYQADRAASRKRDGRKCQMPDCSCRKRLQSHHIIPWSKSYYLRLDVDNLITLCRDCHKKVTGYEHLYVSLFMGIVQQNKKKKRRK